MQKGPRRFGNSAQKYQSKLGRRFLEKHHKPPSNTGIPPQKSEPKIELVTESRLFVARRFARALCKIAKFSGRNAFAKHSKHDRSRLFEIARVLVRFDQVARFITNPNHSAVERIEIRQSRARGDRKTAALRNKNTATAPVHSQKPKCQNTERRSALWIGVAKHGSSRARNNKDSLKKIPTSGNSVTNDQIQNNCVANRFRPRPFHAHQQLHNIPIARKPAAERPRSSWSRRTPKTSWVCCGTTKQAQISAMIPAVKVPALIFAARGAMTSKCRRKSPAKGSINNPVSATPLAASQ